jgi:tetratricopeptide (TPR) repeat protein
VAERATRLALFARNHPRALVAAERWLELDPGQRRGHADRGGAVDDRGAGSARRRICCRRVVGQLGRAPAAIGSWCRCWPSRRIGRRRCVPSSGWWTRARTRPSAWQAHAELALRFEELHLARTVARAGVDRFPDAVQLRMTLARALTELEDPDAALAALAAAVEAHPGRRDVRLAYARALVEVEDFGRARPEFDRLLALAPGDAELLLTTALLSLEAGRFDLAQEYLERLLASGQRAQDANYYLGRLHEQAGDLAAARRSYQAVDEGDARRGRAAQGGAGDGGAGWVPQAARPLFERLQQDSDEGIALRAYLAEANALRDMGEFGSGAAAPGRGPDPVPGFGAASVHAWPGARAGRGYPGSGGRFPGHPG